MEILGILQGQMLQEKDVLQAAELMLKGEPIAFPTETVYGLGAPIFSEKGIKKIFAMKRRPSDNPLIAHISDLSQVEQIAQNLPKIFFQLAKAFFPGPLTLVVQKHPDVPDIVSAGLKTIAIRMPDHPIARELIHAVGSPIVAPSANISGTPSSTSARHVERDFSGQIAKILDGGDCHFGMESTVLDLVSFDRPTLLRPGEISKEKLEEFLQLEIKEYVKGPKSAPGMKYRHYAPKVPVHLYTEESELEKHSLNNSLVLSTKKINRPHSLLKPQTLYRHLREADEKGYDAVVIFCHKQPQQMLWNRLEKITCESNPY